MKITLKDGSVREYDHAMRAIDIAKDISEAVKKSYAGVDKISFDGAHYRKDIAHRALERLK